MPLYTAPAVGQSTLPGSIIRLGGVECPGAISWSVSSNTFYEADTFRVTFAASALPTSNSANWFSKQTEIFVEVLAGFPTDPNRPNASELTSHIYGRVDEIVFDPRGTTITLTGRDLTAAFIDQKLTQTYQNQTASKAIAEIASGHGIDTSQIQPTSTLIGTYYKNDQVRMQVNNSEWDFITWLAREENKVAFMAGKSLYFGPDPRSTKNLYAIDWRQPNDSRGSPFANVSGLRLSRGLTVVKGIVVTVSSASTTKKTPTVQSYPGAAKTIQAGKSSPFGHVQTYYYTTELNRTASQVMAEAERRYNEIISHAMKLEGRIPADNILSISTPIQLRGTGTAWDQIYYPRAITRQMSVDEGYAMDIEAQNTTPELAEATDAL